MMSGLRPFHLAVPVYDLAMAKSFYGGLPGCAEGRSDSRIFAS
jgi:extradiol dioxygenase family protein